MNKRRFIAVTVALAGLAALGLARADETESPMRKESPTNSHLRVLSGDRISLRIGETAFLVDLYDNPTARDLLARLPLTAKANDYPGYDEKVIRLPSGLSMEGAPRSDDPGIPEVGYYAPGQWIALYYGPIGDWPGKVPLGRIHASLDELRAIPDDAAVTIELLED